MTVKEIAELCGVDARTIYRWAEKAESLNDKMSLRNKTGEGSPENPADFTLEETLAIIGEGGKNKALASLLAENAANKNAVAVQNAPPNREYLPKALEKAVQEAVEKAIQEKLAFFMLPAARKRAVKLNREEEIRQEVAAFVEKYLEFTENWFDIVKEADIYAVFKENCIEKNPIPRYAFCDQFRMDYPQARFGRNKQDVAIWHNVRLKGENAGF
jgi:hypothetical protein